ncbi:ferredoxin [Clostridium sp.]|uniref:ferredoxin n=1 Tax=Clostridium sp. TaxID=1506 RepID=UPI003D6D33FB
MKKILVSNKCVACGSCTLMTNLLEEDSEGKVNPVASGKITDEKSKEFLEVIKSCPVSAISIKDENLVESTGKQGLTELKSLIRQNFFNYKIPRPLTNDYRCDINRSSITYNSPSGNCRYDYKSDSKAESAGLSEFDRAMYSQRKALTQEVLVEYRTNQLRKYAYYERKKGNYYFDINQSLSKLISQLVDEIMERTENKAKIPEKFDEIEIGPDYGYEGESYAYRIRYTERVYTDAITSKLSSVSSYKVYVNTDDIEDYKGKDTYCYNLNEVIDEFRGDLAVAIQDVVNDDCGIPHDVNETVNKYSELLTKALNEKANYLIKEIERLA